jgi:threonine aldolase
MKTIDLRSDTVTKPTPAMREDIARAEVGDDVYREDPTVNRLQETAARLTAKEAALFVPSGTMANQASLRALTRPGDVVLAGEGAHLLVYESGAPAGLSGLQVQTIGHGGFFDGATVRAAIAPDESHFAPTRVVAFENTHNVAGGRVFPIDQLKDAALAARERGLALHLDGARLLNAVVATGTPARVWAEPFDTVSFCLSKGLGAPVGSLVCGTGELISRVHRAAAGLHALEHHVERLAEDHANARRLAAGLSRLDLVVESTPETNMVLFRVSDTLHFIGATRERNLLINPVAEGRFRAVTHLDISEADIDDALGRIEEVVSQGGR